MVIRISVIEILIEISIQQDQGYRDLSVRLVEFRLYRPISRSSSSGNKVTENRISVREILIKIIIYRNLMENH